MKINPKTNTLFTDSGKALKVLHCPLQMSWDALPAIDTTARRCASCAREVHDTSRLTDDEVERLLVNDPDACLMVSPTQKNCSILPVEFEFAEMEIHEPRHRDRR